VREVLQQVEGAYGVCFIFADQVRVLPLLHGAARAVQQGLPLGRAGEAHTRGSCCLSAPPHLWHACFPPPPGRLEGALRLLFVPCNHRGVWGTMLCRCPACAVAPPIAPPPRLRTHKQPDLLIGARKGSPLILGIGLAGDSGAVEESKEEGAAEGGAKGLVQECFLASDASAIIEYTNKVWPRSAEGDQWGGCGCGSATAVT
jgi:hypothetical protein